MHTATTFSRSVLGFGEGSAEACLDSEQRKQGAGGSEGEELVRLELDGVAAEADQEGELGLPDPDDEPFLAAALAAKADFLVTGNLSDYPPGKRRGCSVVSPAEFMEVWRKKSPDPKASEP